MSCTRRMLFQGLGIAALCRGLAACTGQEAGGLGQSSTCGADMCVDLTDGANADLTRVGGSMLFDAPNGDTIVVIRTAPDAVVAVSAICTHAGCTVDYDAQRDLLHCPCHGSEFADDGRVLHGPALSALARYDVALSDDTITVRF
jgi:cytochrome b6-f complex iron-sulfur subunit